VVWVVRQSDQRRLCFFRMQGVLPREVIAIKWE